MSWLYTLVAEVLVGLRNAIGSLTGPDTGLTWALAIIALSLLVRLLLLPLNIRQFHAQMRMQKAQPQLQELNRKYKKARSDLERSPLTAEKRVSRMRELQAEHLANTRATTSEHGFRFSSLLLPILLQLVVGFALFRVISEFRPGAAARYGIDPETLASGTEATLLGAPLAARLTSSTAEITRLGGEALAARTGVAVVLVLAVVLSAVSLKQGLNRTPLPSAPTRGSGDPTAEAMADMQRLMRKRGPLILTIVLLVGYALLPLGVLLNILVVVAWMAVYQKVMYSRHPSTPSPTGSALVGETSVPEPKERTAPAARGVGDQPRTSSARGTSPPRRKGKHHSKASRKKR